MSEKKLLVQKISRWEKGNEDSMGGPRRAVPCWIFLHIGFSYIVRCGRRQDGLGGIDRTGGWKGELGGIDLAFLAFLAFIAFLVIFILVG